MSDSERTLTSPSLCARVFVVLAWALFAAAIVLLDWQQESRLHQVINVIGLLGFVVALLWFMFDRKWKIPSIGISTVLVVLYALRWVVHIDDTYATEPGVGLWGAIERLGQLLADRFAWHEEKLGLGWAILHMYWDVVILPIQLVVIAVLIYLPARLPGERDMD